ncbi:hypothetical protein WICPIJ_002022 [Wickerhamomyces pijperi]|uniref:Uncharacterized protein n=1 Tax=Wickerhamomyces pijperi TaxID=599730 RepID=A0A9P8QCG2_WICPI|nr:hypothetical protein WICPIJ_002022 [Wickerhamomyces pijperi]
MIIQTDSEIKDLKFEMYCGHSLSSTTLNILSSKPTHFPFNSQHFQVLDIIETLLRSTAIQIMQQPNIREMTAYHCSQFKILTKEDNT